MLESFVEHLRSSELLPIDSAVLIGYSGGADSTCLLDLLHLAKFNVVAAHLHHGQRAEADEELTRCAEFCEKLGIPFVSGVADVPSMAKDLKIGIEEAGRKARYAFLESAAQRTGCALIATAHTRDDHVESVLLHLMRGSGLSGLAGIPGQRGNIVRPLLPFTRAQTRAYCEEHGLWTHDDPANFNKKFARVRTRLSIIPEMRQINADVESAICRLANIAGEESELLDGMAAAALERAEIPLNGELGFLTKDEEVMLDRHSLAHLPPVLLKRGLRLVAGVLGAQLNYEHILLLAEGLRTTENSSVTAEGGEVVFEWNVSSLHVRRILLDADFRVSLRTPGVVEHDGWRITCTDPGSEIGKSEPLRASPATELDRGKMSGQLYARSFKPGDAMRPLGFSGRRKVADLMAEAGLTRNTRKRLPVVCDMLGPVWVPGVCLDERVRVDEKSAKSFHLQFGPASSSEAFDRNEPTAASVR